MQQIAAIAHITQATPIIIVAFLMAGVAKIRRYNSSIEIFAIAIVSEYVIRVHSKVWGQISRHLRWCSDPSYLQEYYNFRVRQALLMSTASAD